VIRYGNTKTRGRRRANRRDDKVRQHLTTRARDTPVAWEHRPWLLIPPSTTTTESGLMKR